MSVPTFIRRDPAHPMPREAPTLTFAETVNVLRYPRSVIAIAARGGLLKRAWRDGDWHFDVASLEHFIRHWRWEGGDYECCSR